MIYRLFRDIKPANIIKIKSSSSTIRTYQTLVSSTSESSTRDHTGFIQNVKSCFRYKSSAQREDSLPNPFTASVGTIGFFTAPTTGTATTSSEDLLQGQSPRRPTLQSTATVGKSEINDGGASYKLIDFGTAVGVKEADGHGSEVLMTVSEIKFAGTLQYSSPESFNNVKSISFPSDIWSLAVTLFQMISGEIPFEAPDIITASINIGSNLDIPSPDVRDLAPESVRAVISTAFAKVISKGMEKRVENRFRNVDEMATALHGCLVSSGEQMYSAFISYRVFSEKYHAMMLYEVLNNTMTPLGHRVIVYLDAKRLVKGEDWEEGFSQGLMNSLVALPLISAGVIDPLAKLTGSSEDHTDNVAKELILMQILCKQNNPATKLESIFPILIGKPCSVSDANYPKCGNFFTDGSSTNVRRLVDQVSPPTMESVKKFLKKRKIQVPPGSLHTSVSATVKDLFSLQGAQLWAHGDLPPEEIQEDSELWETVSKDQPVPPLDLAQLRLMKAEMRALVPAIHAVVDSAHGQSVARKQAIADTVSRRMELMNRVINRMKKETVQSVFENWAQISGDARLDRLLKAKLCHVPGSALK